MIKTLRHKHPNAKPSNDTMMLHRPFNHVNEIIFDGVNVVAFKKEQYQKKVRTGFPDWMPISGVIQPLATHQILSVIVWHSWLELMF